MTVVQKENYYFEFFKMVAIKITAYRFLPFILN